MKMDIRPPFAVIRDFPAADVAEAKRGKWIRMDSDDEAISKCSVCQFPVSTFWNESNYCPNCGAKMEGDAFPVVRCGECKNYDGEFRCKCFTFDQEGMPVFMRADDFCSYGERKE